eukprot:6491453-Amphidinium_carterae.1
MSDSCCGKHTPGSVESGTGSLPAQLGQPWLSRQGSNDSLACALPNLSAQRVPEAIALPPPSSNPIPHQFGLPPSVGMGPASSTQQFQLVGGAHAIPQHIGMVLPNSSQQVPHHPDLAPPASNLLPMSLVSNPLGEAINLEPLETMEADEAA